jgi:flagellar biosynthesis/type III secretory pathway chaperone
MCLAVAKTNIVEQKSLLLESIEYLKKAKAQEDQMASLAVENAIYIKAASHYHEYFHRSADQVHPFHLMA